MSVITLDALVRPFHSSGREPFSSHLKRRRELYLARMEEEAMKGSYLLVVPTIAYVPADAHSDRITPSRHGSYIFLCPQERELIATARTRFGGRMVMEPDPAHAAQSLVARLRNKGSLPTVEATAYGEADAADYADLRTSLEHAGLRLVKFALDARLR